MPVAGREAVQDWCASARADDQRSLLAWLTIESGRNGPLRTAAIMAAFDSAPNLVRCALDCQSYAGTAADAPGFDLLQRFAAEYAPDGQLAEVPASFNDLDVDSSGDYVWDDGPGAGSSRRRGSSRSIGAGRGGGRGGGPGNGRGRGRGRNRGRGRDNADPDPDDDVPAGGPSQAEFNAMLARLAKLEASPGDGDAGDATTFSRADVSRLVQEGVQAALADINTGKTALNVGAATAKQRRRCTEWDLRPSMRVLDAELPTEPGAVHKNVLKVSTDADKSTRTESDRAAVRSLLFANVLPAERTKKLLLRYPAASSWTLPPEIPVEHALAYDQLGVRGDDANLASKQAVMLDDLRPLVFCLQRLGDLSTLVQDFASVDDDADMWDTDDADSLSKMGTAARDATQAASDVLHILGAKVSEVQRQRDRLAVVAESGVKGAQLQFDPTKFKSVPVAPDSPERWSTIRPDITARAAEVRQRQKQLGLAFDAVAPKGGGGKGKPGGGGGNPNANKNLTKAQREKRARRNAKRADKRRSKSSGGGDKDGPAPEPQPGKGPKKAGK